MTNNQFNNLWDKLHKYGMVQFSNYGESFILSLSGGRYGQDAVLEVINGNIINCICVHWSEEHFRRILVDR